MGTLTSGVRDAQGGVIPGPLVRARRNRSFDLRVSRAFRLGDMGRVEFLMDVLNLLNDTAEEGLVTDTRFSPTFGQPSVFVNPRRVMLGARLNPGR